jgi:hypothetical protein
MNNLQSENILNFETSPSLNKLFKLYRSHVFDCIRTLQPIPSLEDFYFNGRRDYSIVHACRVLDNYVSEFSRVHLKSTIK